MGFLADKREKYQTDEFLISAIPILSALNAGRILTLPPKVIAARFIIWLGEAHPDDCECEVCVAWRNEGAKAQVARQRARIFGVTEDQAYGSLFEDEDIFDEPAYVDVPLCEDDEEDELSVEEVAYWAQWYRDRFPLSYAEGERKLGSLFLVDELNRADPTRYGSLVFSVLASTTTADLGISAEDLHGFELYYRESEGDLSMPAVVDALDLYCGGSYFPDQ